MWPSKKDKGIEIPPGKSIEIGFGVEWRKGKDEVVIITDNDRFVLNGKNALFLEVTSNNTDSIRVQIIPDFRKRVINVVEVINADAKPVTGEDKCKISFAGVTSSKDDTLPIGEFLQRWDEKIEEFDKRIRGYKKRRNVLMIFATVVAVGNVYLFTINSSPMRYLDVIAVLITTYVLFRLWNSYRDLNGVYEDYKKERSQAFEVAKNQ